MTPSKKALLSLATAAAILASLFSGCAGESAQDTQASPQGGATPSASDSGDVIRIGVVECLTGDNAAPGALCALGAQLANELRPTVLGRPVELVVVDCKSDKVEAANATSRLIERDNVVAIMGPAGSGFNLAMSDLVKEAQIPTIVSNATSPLVTQDNPYYFRSCFTNDFHAYAMAHYAYQQGMRKIGIVKEITQDAAVDCANQFAQLFQELTGDPDAIVVEVSYAVQDQDYNAQLVTLSQHELDAVFAPNTAVNLALMMNQARDMGLDLPWLAIDSCEVPEFITLGGDAVVESCFFSTFFDTAVSQTPTTDYLLEEYEKRYPGEEVASFVALNFDAYNLLLEAIEMAGSTDGDAIRQALNDIEGYQGATGYLTFDENRNIENLAVIKTVGADGTFQYVATVTTD